MPPRTTSDTHFRRNVPELNQGSDQCNYTHQQVQLH